MRAAEGRENNIVSKEDALRELLSKLDMVNKYRR